MKLYSLLMISICLLTACQSQQQSDAKKLAAGIQGAVKEHSPGSIATSATGYSMKAKINGKDWVAVAMMPIQGIDRVIGYIDDGGYIGLGVNKDEPQGRKLNINETNAADLYIVNGGEALLDKTKGQIVITKQDGQWMEGTFYFTASSSQADKTIQVTDGTFRIPLTPATSK
ncbi:hypothetical protein CLV51_104420 [Chitinophaga niastensis]|uniref:Lipoprotein n=1 Tax=Chitinophaga niastensis TaxID=536980 RepID=A0A2P8HHM4_CHINA|nr:DUF6252 family protein [Chitinophaga niastensis]PSL45713.1 hypothetical protein CLV51_104420 [Chitinophaga niastensis]